MVKAAYPLLPAAAAAGRCLPLPRQPLLPPPCSNYYNLEQAQLLIVLNISAYGATSTNVLPLPAVCATTHLRLETQINHSICLIQNDIIALVEHCTGGGGGGAEEQRRGQ